MKKVKIFCGVTIAFLLLESILNLFILTKFNYYIKNTMKSKISSDLYNELKIKIDNQRERDNTELINMVEDIYLSRIESDGFLTKENYDNLQKELSNKFLNSKIIIEGTSNKVDTNEKVFLKLNVQQKDLNGKIIYSYTVRKTGTVKY